MNDGWLSFPVRVSGGFSSIDRRLDVANLDRRHHRRHGKIPLRAVRSQTRQSGFDRDHLAGDLVGNRILVVALAGEIGFGDEQLRG